MNNFSRAALAVGAAMSLTALAPGQQEITLKVGDPAPSLTIGEWVKGDAVPAFTQGKAYVVEFWATW
jgi:hypothetical protein